MEEGTKPNLSKNEPIPRRKIVNRLKDIYQPGENPIFYHVVCGQYGIGKTTLTSKVAREVEKEFGASFGKTLNFKFEDDVSFTARMKLKYFGYPTELKWKRALRAFRDASEVYKAKHGKPSVIIYGNISRLVHKNPEIIDILQVDAKNYADKRIYVAVFISSEGLILRRMEFIKQHFLTEAEKKFRSAKLLPNDPFYEKGEGIISKLLKSKEISFLAFKKHFHKAEELNKVLESNVFAYHPETIQ
ncbi:hypothetical protein C1645_736483 [Glomus cerebriforme]|uniref:P-loop containing nucleoside triphosphate hydrolase protein n=1 Tax=Glomus cerebriforme TaxID=658196 RepID=A0A397T4I4_9GLOM|nr:hypothetical protein C1645_736483 [Glomus cerebriforme]